MTAPAATVRQSPSGRKLGEGYQTLITIALDPNIEFWENEVTPPGFEGDEMIDTTTQHNVKWHTMSPGSLMRMTEIELVVFYDPIVLNSISAVIGINTTITVAFPDGSTWAFYGSVRVFKPNALSRGNPPTANITIVPTNTDPSTCEEEDPVYVAGSGTAPSC